jgi:hypothetical protein
MPKKEFPIAALRIKLAEVGVKKDFIDSVLPSHWDDEFSSERTGLLRACSLLSRVLGLELKPMLEAMPTISFKALDKPLYKKAANKVEDDLEVATRVGVAAASIAVRSISTAATLLPAAKDLRGSIIASGKKWVDLESLLQVCWSSGLPVIYVKKMAGKKMEAMAVKVDGRPAIVVSHQVRFRSRLAFWIAHEMGHIALGHLDSYSAIPDPQISREATDDLEVQANLYALELLFGHAEPKYKTTADIVYPDALATGAKELGLKNNVDPGAIINNWCYHELRKRKSNGLSATECNRTFGTATAALRKAGDPEDGLDLIDAHALLNLSGPVPRDSAELFQNLTELNLAA